MSQTAFTEKSNRSLSEFEFLHDPNDKSSKLGVGSFSCVKLAREKKSGKLFALKIVSINPSKVSASDMHNLRTEIHIHKKLDHPNIIRFFDFVKHENNVYLILDYAEHGNLYSYLHRKKVLTENEVFRFFYQSCLAIQYLHENDILHRDIKPENLLLDKHFNLKICDFGWSAQRIHEKRMTFCGTYEYMAPEIIQKKPYDYRVDIWSLGILLFELLHREPPYKGRSLPEISQSIVKTTIHYSSSINPDAKDLIKMILKLNASERPSMAEILSHPWVKSHLQREEHIKKMDENISPRNSKLSIYNQSVSSQINSQNIAPSSKAHEELSKDTKPKLKNYHTERELSHESPLLKLKSPTSQNQTTRYDAENYKARLLQEHSSLLNLKTLGDQYNLSNAPSSKSSMAKQMMENLGFENGKKTPSTDALRKKKIFETSMLSPTFKTKINTIINQLGPHTTTHKGSENMGPLLSSRSPTHQKALTIFNEVTSGARDLLDYQPTEYNPLHYSTQNYKAFQSTQFTLNNLSPTNFKKSSIEIPKGSTPSTTTNRMLQTKTATNFKSKDMPPMTSSFSSSNLTKKRELTRGELSSSQIGAELALKQLTQENERSRSPNYHVSNPLGSLDQNRNKTEESTPGIQFNQFYKGLEHKRKSNFRSIDEYSSASTKQYSLIDTKVSYSKENRPDTYLKENKSPISLDRIYSSRTPILKENI